jgi:A/G-specific adenine glycosylase
VVDWQQQHGRTDLPWQNTRDPYRVWLSEIMLQQTQVATVRGYFARFLERFPTVQDLSAASQDDVMGLWSGLGYYTRARNLHRCAQAIVHEHGSSFPRSTEVLATLPGIGRSTAAAIASLCFGERSAILDANVKRVLTRVLAFHGDLATAAAERHLWTAAHELLPVGANASRDMPRYTQGLMDLGATVCSVKSPNCTACPVQTLCAGHRSGDPTRYPLRNRKLKRSSQSLWLLWLQRADGAVYLSKRPTPGVWAGLYCLPLFDSLEQLWTKLDDVFQADGPVIELDQLETLTPFLHVLTHRNLHLHPVRLRQDALNLLQVSPAMKAPVPHGAPGLNARWIAASEWPALGLPAPIRKLLQSD